MAWWWIFPNFAARTSITIKNRTMKMNRTAALILAAILATAFPFAACAEEADTTMVAADNTAADIPLETTGGIACAESLPALKVVPRSPYEQPYSFTANTYDWHRLWVNTTVLSTAFVGTLFVLECLPEDATAWNRAEIQDVPLFKRWHNHVIKEGPEWDHDKFYFNYILHPYAGAAYFMAARSCGFNFWKSALYSSVVSTVGWEFGIEAFMERPSIQDLFVTPVVGSCIGEGFYRVKRWLVANDYRLFGSPVLGEILAFLVDPVNEFTGLWLGNPARQTAHKKALQKRGVALSLVPTITSAYKGFSGVFEF